MAPKKAGGALTRASADDLVRTFEAWWEQSDAYEYEAAELVAAAGAFAKLADSSGQSTTRSAVAQGTAVKLSRQWTEREAYSFLLCYELEKVTPARLGRRTLADPAAEVVVRRDRKDREGAGSRLYEPKESLTDLRADPSSLGDKRWHGRHGEEFITATDSAASSSRTKPGLP